MAITENQMKDVLVRANSFSGACGCDALRLRLQSERKEAIDDLGQAAADWLPVVGKSIMEKKRNVERYHSYSE